MRSQSVARVSDGRSLSRPEGPSNRPDSGAHERAEPAPHLEQGCRVAGRFRIGGRTENRRDRQCYDAWDEAVERWVILTVSRRPAVRDARLVHPGIAQPQEVGCIGSWFVSVLDPGVGESLGRLLGRLGPESPLDLESWMIFGLGLCEALEQAGRFGLVHGDIGTRSIHVSPRFDPVLLGFPARPDGSLSKASRAFASPERILGHAPDFRSDVYAVAALLYTLRAGVPPFGWSDDAARDGHLYRQLEAHPRIPGRVMRELQRGMEKPARLRHPTVRHFADAVSAAYEASAEGWLAEEVCALDEDTTEEVALIEPTGFDLSDYDAFDELPTELPGEDDLELGPDAFEPPIDPVWESMSTDDLMRGPDDLTLEDEDLAPALPPVESGRGLARRLAGPAAGAKRTQRGQPVARLHDLVQGRLALPAVGEMNDETLELGVDMLDLDGDVTLELGPQYLATPPASAHTPPPQTGPRAHRPAAPEQGASRGRSMPRQRLADRAPSPGAAARAPVAFVPPAPLSVRNHAPDFGWSDTMDPPTPGLPTELGPDGVDAHLPAILLAALCAIAVGMAGAASVLAVIAGLLV
jgi:hypothetical protein